MKHFLILLKDNLLHALKSKKTLIFVALYVAIFALIVHGIKEAEKELFQRIYEQGIDPNLANLASNFAIEFLKINSNEIIEKILSIPIYSLQLFGVMLLGTPFLILMVYYDKLSQETSDGTYRYFLFRTSRAKIYWAKFASMVIEIAILTLLATLLAVLYGHYTLDFFQTKEVLKASLIYWTAGLTPLVTFASMVFMFSAMVRQPFLALLLSSAAVIGALIILAFLPQISPFYLDYWKGFFIPGTSLMLNSVLIYLGFTLLCTFLGFIIFKKRDL